MSWSELRILRDDTERENLRKQTSDTLPLDATSPVMKNYSSAKRSQQNQHRRNLLGKLVKDLDYLESLIKSVKLFDYENNSYDHIKASDNKNTLSKSKRLDSFSATKKSLYIKADHKKGMDYGVKVRREAQDAILFLKRRQDFWSQLKPMYCNNP